MFSAASASPASPAALQLCTPGLQRPRRLSCQLEVAIQGSPRPGGEAGWQVPAMPAVDPATGMSLN